MDQAKPVNVYISPRAIITIALTLLGLWVLFQLREILVLFLIVVAIVVAFSPIIRSWERYIPRTLAIIVLYTLLILGLILISAIFIPVVFRQLNDFINYIERILAANGYPTELIADQLRNTINLFLRGRGVEAIIQVLSQFRGSLGAVYSTTVGVLGGLVAILTVFITSFYLLQEEKHFHDFLGTLFPPEKRKKVAHITDRISEKMGGWLRGQLSLMVIVGLLNGIALAILGVPYALLLGVWSGVMELLPFIGPVLGAIPGVFLAFTTLGVVKGFVAIGIYLLVQQLENQVLVPKIMGRAVGLSPVVIIFSLLIGGKLLGFVGLLIAVPIAAAISVIFDEWRKDGL